MDPDIARKVLPAMGDDAGSDATVEALRARLSELEGVLRYVGKQLTSADLGDHNCASWDVCNKRLRNLGKRALAACAAHKPLDTSDDVG